MVGAVHTHALSVSLSILVSQYLFFFLYLSLSHTHHYCVHREEAAEEMMPRLKKMEEDERSAGMSLAG